MEIKTKFNIGDQVWWIKNGTPQTGKIVSLHTHVYNMSDLYISTEYDVWVESWASRIEILERLLFSTKEELLKSL